VVNWNHRLYLFEKRALYATTIAETVTGPEEFSLSRENEWGRRDEFLLLLM
jgi:hypothetical protein